MMFAVISSILYFSACNLRRIVDVFSRPTDLLRLSLLLFNYFIRLMASPQALLNSLRILQSLKSTHSTKFPLFWSFLNYPPFDIFKVQIGIQNGAIGLLMKVALIYINQSQLLKLRMKKVDKPTKNREETYSETCSGDSDSLASPRRHSVPRGKTRKQKNRREVLQPSPTQIRLFRFKLKHSRKTLRIPLFEEDLLNLPLRFTKRINAMEIDNDVETDQQMAGSEAQRCETWLRQAIAQHQQTM